jgi:hypothetical protein
VKQYRAIATLVQKGWSMKYEVWNEETCTVSIWAICHGDFIYAVAY